jgi:hypothetical protein
MRPERLAGPSVAVVAAALVHPLCNLFFRCGCTIFGLAAHCNVHAAAGPRCPWCAHPASFGIALLAGALTALLAMYLAGRRAPRRFWPRFVAGLAGAVLGLLLDAAATAAASGYPHFLWF